MTFSYVARVCGRVHVSRGPAHRLSVIKQARSRPLGSGSLSAEWAKHGGHSRTHSGSHSLSVPLQEQCVIKFPEECVCKHRRQMREREALKMNGARAGAGEQQVLLWDFTVSESGSTVTLPLLLPFEPVELVNRVLSYIRPCSERVCSCVSLRGAELLCSCEDMRERERERERCRTP